MTFLSGCHVSNERSGGILFGFMDRKWDSKINLSILSDKKAFLFDIFVRFMSEIK
jgi:hypothetical protein